MDFDYYLQFSLSEGDNLRPTTTWAGPADIPAGDVEQAPPQGQPREEQPPQSSQKLPVVKAWEPVWVECLKDLIDTHGPSRFTYIHGMMKAAFPGFNKRAQDLVKVYNNHLAHLPRLETSSTDGQEDHAMTPTAPIYGAYETPQPYHGAPADSYGSNLAPHNACSPRYGYDSSHTASTNGSGPQLDYGRSYEGSQAGYGYQNSTSPPPVHASLYSNPIGGQHGQHRTYQPGRGHALCVSQADYSYQQGAPSTVHTPFYKVPQAGHHNQHVETYRPGHGGSYRPTPCTNQNHLRNLTIEELLNPGNPGDFGTQHPRPSGATSESTRVLPLFSPQENWILLHGARMDHENYTWEQFVHEHAREWGSRPSGPESLWHELEALRIKRSRQQAMAFNGRGQGNSDLDDGTQPYHT